MNGQTTFPEYDSCIPPRIVGQRPWKPGLDRPGSLHSRAFTLLELLIAMGILAVGGAMAAALFPAAIRENQRANNSVVGNNICENALSTLQAKLSSTSAPPPPYFSAGMLVPYIGFGQTNTNTDNVYPQPYFPKPTSPDADDPDWYDDGGTVVPKSLRGFLVLGRQISEVAGVFTYQLVIVSYRLYDNTSSRNPADITVEVEFTSTPGTTDFTIDSVETGGTVQKVQLGSPLIHRKTGRFATIMSYNSENGTGTLDRPIFPKDIDPDDIDENNDGDKGYVIQDTYSQSTRSPAIRLMVWSGKL